MKRYIIIVFLLLVQYSFATPPQELLDEANEAYKRSEYAHSIELYEKVLDQGLEAADLYYNLGNAYFKSDMPGPAILNYERALRLKPWSDDIAHNLAVARSKTIDKLERHPLLFYERWWKAAYSLLGADGWSIMSIILIVLFLGATSLYLFSNTLILKKTSFYFMLLLFALGVLSMVFAKKQFNRIHANQEAIIMQTRVTAKSSPSDQSPDLFLMHEGTKVTIRSSLGQWQEVSLPNGNVGWIKEETIEVI